MAKLVNSLVDAKCPGCGRPADRKYRPFCSKRCADLDLGKWLDEAYRVPAVEPPDDWEPDDTMSADETDGNAG